MKLHNRTLPPLLPLLVAAFALTGMGCGGNNVQAKDAWQQVLEPCIRGGVMGNDVTFFGPSNNVGAGAVWRKRADGGYALVWSPAIQTPRLPANAINRNPTTVCSGETDKNFSGSIGGSLVSSAVSGMSAEANVLSTGSREGLIQRCLNTASDEMKDGAALHHDRATRV